MSTASSTKAQRITEHIYKLEAIFPEMLANKRGISRYGYKQERVPPGRVWSALHRLEAEAHSAAERYSSYPTPEGYIEKKEASILKRLNALLHFRAAGVPVFVNLDPRGYALKIDADYVRTHGLDIHTDWGGYGILVPEFSGRR